MWERGLKQENGIHLWNIISSLPMWERGLKQLMALCNSFCQVAPHVGAWIETIRHSTTLHVIFVAPHVGAWIETPPDASA